MIPKSLIEDVKMKLFSKVVRLENGCWIYEGYTDPNGYADWRPYPPPRGTPLTTYAGGGIVAIQITWKLFPIGRTSCARLRSPPP